jgi:DNA-binding MarR family transcriptional regulator
MIAHAMTLLVPHPVVEAAGPVAEGHALALWQALAAAHAALVERLDPEVADCAVVGTDTLAVLLPLSLAPDHRLRMHELADRSNVTRSGLTRRVDRLVADGLVEREHCVSDRRGAYTRLTEAGARELARALPHHVAAIERHVTARLSERDVATLTELLQRL